MQRIQRELPPTCEIVCITDTHLGGTLCHEKGIQKAIDYIAADPNRYWLHLGDWIGAITSDDKRWSQEEVKIPTPIEQAALAVETFRPIAEKCLVGLNGNHERKLHRFGAIVEKLICEPLKIPFGTYSARIVLPGLFNIYCTHGRLSLKSNAKDFEQRTANMKATLKMRLMHKMADCAVMLVGDCHKLLVVEPSKILYMTDGKDGVQQNYLKGETTGKYINPDQRWYAACGSFERISVDGVSGYAERLMLDPVPLGAIIIKIKNTTIRTIEEFLV